MSSNSKAVGQRAHTTFGGDVHPRVCASPPNVVVPAGLPERRGRMLIPGAWHSTRPDVANFGQKRGRECRAVPELTTRIDHPPQSWLRRGRHANYLTG